MSNYRIIVADVLAGLAQLPDESVHCCVTSPPYWGLRDYGVPGQLGLEPSPDEYVARMVAIFREVRRVLRADGTLWLNLGDSYASTTGVQTNHPQQSRNGQQGVVGPRDKHPSASRANLSAFKDFTGLKPKDLVGIPWRVAFALQADGWWLRQDIIWAKPNPMPESVTDRCTKAHEYIFLLSKSARYWYDAEAVKEESVDPESHRGRNPRNDDKFVGQAFSETRGGFSKIEAGTTYPTRNARSVWTIATAPYPEAHFATFPPALPERCIKAGCPVGGTVLDPFAGSGTTLAMALTLDRQAIGIELNPEYATLAHRRIGQATRPNTYRDESKAGDAPLFGAICENPPKSAARGLDG